MSYKFDAGGYLTFKTYEDYEKTDDVFRKYGILELSDYQEIKTVRKQTVCVTPDMISVSEAPTRETYVYCDVCGSGHGYDEEEISYTLAEAIPYILEGQIDYEGEDSVLWRHQFNQEKKEWEELSGRIVYEKPTPFAKKTPIQEEEEERE